VNGVYYSSGGGAISITTTGTKITATSSLDFTSSVTGTSADYTFTIGPGNFAAGEAVPVIIYSRDASNNLMEQVVYALPVVGGSCPAGSSFCGSNSTWNGSLCVGNSCAAGSTYCGTNTAWDGALCNANASPSGSTYCGSATTWNGSLCIGDASPSGSTFCGSNTSWNGSSCIGTGGGSATPAVAVGGGGPAYLTSSAIKTATISQVDENSVVVSWAVGVPGTGWVVYDTVSSDGSVGAPKYGYKYRTDESKDERSFHTVLIKGLKPGVLYYFRPASKVNNDTFVLGPELMMAPRFAQTIVKEVISQEQGTVICKNDITKEKIIYRDVIKEKACVSSSEKTCPKVEIQTEPAQCPTISSSPSSTVENKPTPTPTEPQAQQNEPVVYVIPKKVIGLSWPLYVLIALTIPALGLIINALRLRKKVRDIADNIGTISNTQEDARPFSGKNILIAVAITAVAIATIAIFWSLLGPTGFLDKLRGNLIKSSQKTLTVSGSIVDPVNYQGIAGVDLSLNETTIHTSAGGYYIFSNANENATIQINHPMLNRTILKTINEPRMKIYFDAKMYNALIDIVNMEARGKYSDVYRNLADEAKKKTSFENFAAGYKAIFSQDDISAQTITIGKVEILNNWNNPKYDTNFAKVVKISVENNGAIADYYLSLTGGVWKLVK